MCGCIYYLYDDDNLEEALHVLTSRIVYVSSADLNLSHTEEEEEEEEKSVGCGVYGYMCMYEIWI